MVADRKEGTLALAKSLHLIPKLEAKRKISIVAWAFKTSKPTLSDILPQAKPHLLILVKQFH